MTTQVLSQLNIRLDSGVKRAGEAVLAKEGTNPTTLVRALWQKIARGAADLHQVEEVLGLRTKAETVGDDASEKLTAMRRGRALFAEGLTTLGIDPAHASPPPDTSDADLYAEALVDRLEERGLW